MLPPMTGGTAPALAPRAWPVITFNQEIKFYFNDDIIKIFHVPEAHTDGDAIIHFERADVIHAGDVFFNGRYPNIDNGAGGTLSGMIAALEQIAQSAGPQTRIIAGHGPIGQRSDVLAAAAMLRVVRERVACLIANGQSEDEAVAAEPLRDLEADWAWFIRGERMVRHAYLSLTRAHAPDPATFCLN